jgi:DNA-directed RNA polymerase specialized sigma24 family protein
MRPGIGSREVDTGMPVAAEEIYERFDEDLRAFVFARVGDRDAAEDVLQDVYLRSTPA